MDGTKNRPRERSSRDCRAAPLRWGGLICGTDFSPFHKLHNVIFQKEKIVMKTKWITASVLLLLLTLIGTSRVKAQIADGNYSIVAKHSGKCLDVSGAS